VTREARPATLVIHAERNRLGLTITQPIAMGRRVGELISFRGILFFSAVALENFISSAAHDEIAPINHTLWSAPDMLREIIGQSA
jgi:hypothetical protein